MNEEVKASDAVAAPVDGDVMPRTILASICGGYEDHGFGGCCWGSGEKYLSKYAFTIDEGTGAIYHSDAVVQELRDALAYMVANIGQSNALETRDGFAKAKRLAQEA